jgi:hypothetical protein
MYGSLWVHGPQGIASVVIVLPQVAVVDGLCHPICKASFGGAAQDSYV